MLQMLGEFICARQAERAEKLVAAAEGELESLCV